MNCMKALIIIIVCITPQLLTAQQAPIIVKAVKPVIKLAGKPIEKKINFSVPMQNLTTEQGLCDNVVYCGLCDKKGNLWFGTYGGGMSRYDGNTFTNFGDANGMVSHVVICMMEDKAGNLWFGTYGGGFGIYDGRRLRCYSPSNKNGLSTVRGLIEDDNGNIWVGTAGDGVFCYPPAKNGVCGKPVLALTEAQGLAQNSVWSMIKDRKGNLWFGTVDNGVTRYTPGNIGLPGTCTNFNISNGLADNHIRSIGEDKAGNIWIGTNGKGVCRYDGKIFTTYTTALGLGADKVYTITLDREGNLWIGTHAGGLSLYNPEKDGKEKCFTNFNSYTSSGITNNNINSITEDKEGNLWIGGDGGGISCYSSRSLSILNANNGLENCNINCILEDHQGNIWMGTDGGGIYLYSADKMNKKSPDLLAFTKAQGLIDNAIGSIMEDRKGRLWFGSVNGACMYDGKSFANFTTNQGLSNNNVTTILEDKTGNIWFCNYWGGLNRYDGKTFTIFKTQQGLANNNVTSILEDISGNYWIGTDGGGISRYNTAGQFKTFTTADGLADNSVLGLLQDAHGNMWIGTKGGLSRYHNGSFLTFTTLQGLAEDHVQGLAKDKEGTIWLGTNLGLTSLSFMGKNYLAGDNNLSNEELKNYKVIFDTYNKKTGYPIKDLIGGANNHGSLTCDSKGILWVGCGDGNVITFDYKNDTKNKNKPGLVIKNIRVDNENLIWNDIHKTYTSDSLQLQQSIIEELSLFGKPLSKAQRDTMRQRFSTIAFDTLSRYYPVPQKLILPYNHNSITIDYAAIEPAKPYLVGYQYKLEGYDKYWTPLTNKTSATFGNMHEGVYTFIIKARSPLGVWSDPVTYTFRVLPPWYRTWWAYILYAISGLVIIWGFSKWRNRKLQMEAIVLRKKVEMATKEIRNEKEKSDDLLLNILPASTAEELKATGSAKARSYDNVTVMFTDFKNFTEISKSMSAEDLVQEINYCYSEFDRIMAKYNIEKIKTIGDSYMCVSGLPLKSNEHALNAVKAAIEMNNFMKAEKEIRQKNNSTYFEMRIGLHSGPVVAGIVGIKKFAYDVWGDTVNIASRMETSGAANKINISETTYHLVKDKFNCYFRGEVEAKNMAGMNMYFIEE